MIDVGLFMALTTVAATFWIIHCAVWDIGPFRWCRNNKKKKDKKAKEEKE